MSVLLAASAILLAGCERGDPLPWSDDFSNPDVGWQTEVDTSAVVGYYDSAIRVLVKAQDCIAWAWAGRRFSDFDLTVEATQISGPDDNEYGVLVRMEDNDHFYSFSISGDGYYRVRKYDDGVWELLSNDWTRAEAVRVGAATNVLQVVGEGRTMTFLANGVQLVQVVDGSFRSGDVGLFAGTFRAPGVVEISFDNLSVTEP